MTHTDIKRQVWIEQYCPATLRPYAYLMRLDRPIGTWLLLLPCLWAVALANEGVRGVGLHDLKLAVLFWIGALVMRGAGCAINDLWDIRLDRQVARTKTRPLAAGDISPRAAIIFTLGLLLIGLFILMQLGPTAILLGFLSAVFIILYPTMKRLTWWPQAFLGLTFNFGALIGWAAVEGFLEGAALLLYIGGFFWTLAYDTIYACQDIEDDMRVGIKSTARLFGENVRLWVAVFFALGWVCLLGAVLAGNGSLVGSALMILPALHVIYQMQNWQEKNPASSLQTFKRNRDFGLLVLFACLLAL